MKSSVFECQQGHTAAAALELSTQPSPKFAELYMIQGQVHQTQKNQARCMSHIERFASDIVRQHACSQGAFRAAVSILPKCSTAFINKHPANISPPWNLALQMHLLASSAFLEMQAVISSLPSP
jgi:hypothetical protein